jgi:hypothetical protein
LYKPMMLRRLRQKYHLAQELPLSLEGKLCPHA